MLSKAPAGDPVGRAEVKNVSLTDVIPKKKGKVYVVRVTGEGSGWVIVKGKEKVLAAHYEKLLDYPGKSALEKIARELRRGCTVEVETLPDRVAELYLYLNPRAAVLEPLDEVMLATRVDEAVTAPVTPVEQFTEAWEEDELKVEAAAEARAKTVVEAKEEETERAGEVPAPAVVGATTATGAERSAAPETAVEIIRTREKTAVENLGDFVSSLRDFVGVVRAKEGSTDFTLFVRRGDIVGAVLRDGDVEIKGMSVLLYLDTQAEVTLEEGEFEVPDDARCEVDEAAMRVYYSELDRAGDRR